MAKTYDHELKLQRASKHLEDLSTTVSTWWSDPNHYSIRHEVDNRDGRTVFYVKAEQIPRDPFSLIVGDCLHNLRSSLDLLAFALAKSYTSVLPYEIAEASEFPIFGDEDRQGNTGTGSARFNHLDKRGNPVHGSGLHKIRGMHPGAQAIIEGLQPYRSGTTHRSHPLSILHHLDRLNKHRLLHVVAAWFGGFYLLPSASRNWQIVPGAIESRESVIETETIVARIPLAKVDPELEMHVEIQPSLDVAFSNVPGIRNVSVLRTLADCLHFIVTEVVPPLTPYLR